MSVASCCWFVTKRPTFMKNLSLAQTHQPAGAALMHAHDPFRKFALGRQRPAVECPFADCPADVAGSSDSPLRRKLSHHFECLVHATTPLADVCVKKELSEASIGIAADVI